MAILDRYTGRNVGDPERILEQIEALRKKIEGSQPVVIKPGHIVQGLSDGSTEVLLPMSGRQLARRRLELNRLTQVLEEGMSWRRTYPRK